jgi:hypothetical protein
MVAAVVQSVASTRPCYCLHAGAALQQCAAPASITTSRAPLSARVQPMGTKETHAGGTWKPGMDCMPYQASATAEPATICMHPMHPMHPSASTHIRNTLAAHSAAADQHGPHALHVHVYGAITPWSGTRSTQHLQNCTSGEIMWVDYGVAVTVLATRAKLHTACRCRVVVLTFLQKADINHLAVLSAVSAHTWTWVRAAQLSSVLLLQHTSCYVACTATQHALDHAIDSHAPREMLHGASIECTYHLHTHTRIRAMPRHLGDSATEGGCKNHVQVDSANVTNPSTPY